jgi:hypothetical protein
MAWSILGSRSSEGARARRKAHRGGIGDGDGDDDGGADGEAPFAEPSSIAGSA